MGTDRSIFSNPQRQRICDELFKLADRRGFKSRRLAAEISSAQPNPPMIDPRRLRRLRTFWERKGQMLQALTIPMTFFTLGATFTSKHQQMKQTNSETWPDL